MLLCTYQHNDLYMRVNRLAQHSCCMRPLGAAQVATEAQLPYERGADTAVCSPQRQRQPAKVAGNSDSPVEQPGQAEHAHTLRLVEQQGASHSTAMHFANGHVAELS
jgi:hypothetical protein